MKHTFVLGCLIAAVGATSAFSAPQNYAEPERVRFVPKSGDWENAKNWSNQKLPSGFTRVYIPGDKTVTVSGRVETVDNVNLGSDKNKPGTVNIVKGGKMAVAFISVLGTVPNAEGVLYLRGGELLVGNDRETLGQLCVGAETSFSGKGFVEFQSGKFTGGLTVGSPAAQTQEGVLRVVGSKSEIGTHAKGRNFLRLNPSGVIEFELDDKGVSTLNYRGARFLSEGGTIRVDGKQYAGPSKRIELIVADKITNQPPKVEISNFTSQYDVTAARERIDGNSAEAIVLKITQKKR